METAITKEEAVVVSPVATTVEPEKVVLTKEEHDKLVKERDDARTLQGQADARAARLASALGGKGGAHFSAPAAAAAAPTKQEQADYAAEEDRKAAQGLQRLALKPEFRAALDADPTLMGLFQSNPLAVLPLLAPDALDAEDAVALVSQALTGRVDAITKAKTPVVPVVETKPADVTPPAGGVNTKTPIQNEEYEAARKNTNLEGAIAGMIKVGLKSLPQK